MDETEHPDSVPLPGHDPSSLPVEPGHIPEIPEGLQDQLLTFLFTLAQWLGQLVTYILDLVLPIQVPANLTSPIGFLALLTVFLLLTEIAKKIAWIILLVGWVLIVARLSLLWMGNG